MIRQKSLVVTACAAGAAVLVTGGVLVSLRVVDPAHAETVTEKVLTGSATVERGDLRGTTTATGALSGESGSTIPGGPSGTLTAVPEIGTIISPRGTLYRVDDLPVTFFAGALPQWRSFEVGMTDGPDVVQLEANLRSWGYLTVLPDGHFDWRTRAAVRSWQKDAGLPVTGTVEQGRIWFGEGDQVVSDRKIEVGQQVAPGTTVYLTTGTRKIVTVDLPIGSPLAKVGGVAEVEVPGAGRLSGRIHSVGDPATDDDGKVTVPVVVRFDDPEKVGSLDRIDVSVDFVSETRKDALSVPVIALGARSGGGFVVEVIGAAGVTRRVPVRVGLFAGDRVEITSGALKAGDRVVVPA